MNIAVLALLTSLLSAPQDNPAAPEVKKAKAYLAEVKKHLLESYIEREKLKGPDVEKAGVKGLAEAADHKDLAALPEDERAKLKDAVSKRETLDDALDAAAEVIGDGSFDWTVFADHAARAMVKSTGDPFSRLLTADDFSKLWKLLQGGQREDSIGLAVQPSDKGFTVAYVQYGYVAYDEGIEMGDEIAEVSGKAIAGKSPEDVNELLRLKPGEELTLTVRRPGHKDAYAFRLVQRKHKAKDVHYAMLGEGVGYLRLTVFDNGAAAEVKKALRALKDHGMTSLIFDLRHNPGGALPASTAVADIFLPQNLLITKVEMNYKPSLFGMPIPWLGGDQQYRTKSKTDFEEMPMRVLVNRASASASELLAGALQDHKRGALIGETTYGKGVGQTPIPLTSTGNALLPTRFLYLTVLRYTLPTGRSIDHKGVVPDVKYASKRVTPETFAELWRVRTSKGLAGYLEARWKDHAGTFRRLAEYDGFETKDYPDFETFYKSLKTSVGRDDVRGELRAAIRRRMTAEDGVQLVADLQTDVQLQYALVDLLDSRK